MLQAMGLQRVGHSCLSELNKRETRCFLIFHISSSLRGRITGLLLSLSLSSFSYHLRLMTATERVAWHLKGLEVDEHVK